MGNSSYRLIQLTNANIGAVAVNNIIPIGIMTRQIKRDNACTPTFDVTTSVNNAVYVQEAGFYKITYTGYLTVGAAGSIVVQLQINGVTMATATVSVAAAGTYLVSLVFVTRAFNNCNTAVNLPLLIQLNNAGIALTGGTSNLIIERVSC